MWRFQIKVLLNASDLLHYITDDAVGVVAAGGNTTVHGEGVTGGAETHGGNVREQKAVKDWLRGDGKAQKIIVMTLGQQPLMHVMNCKTPKEMWCKLESIYEFKSTANVHRLQQKFYSFQKDPQDDIAMHISKLETLVSQLKDVGENISTTMVITKILMTLPPSFAHFYSAWESTAADQQTIENLTARLIMEETRLNTSCLSSNTGEAFVARQKTKNNNKTNKKPGKCFICKKPGHWKRECYLNKANKNRENDIRGNAFVCEREAADSIDKENEWYVDSGASDHMTNKKEYFVKYTEFEIPMEIRLGDGNIIKAYGSGAINIFSYNNNKWSENHLANVLFVPDIRLNLFSTTSALEKGLKMSSDYQRCEFSKNNTTVLVGIRTQKLFKLLIKVNLPSKRNNNFSYVTESKQMSLTEWHCKLAHQNIVHCKRFLKNSNIIFKD